jgi:hypothetical protein
MLRDLKIFCAFFCFCHRRRSACRLRFAFNWDIFRVSLASAMNRAWRQMYSDGTHYLADGDVTVSVLINITKCDALV